MHPLRVAVELDVFEHVLLRLLPRLVALAVHQLALERLQKVSASALSHGLPGRDMDWAISWDSRQRRNARNVHWERRTRVVGTFPNGKSALMLVAAHLKYVADSEWGSRRYLDASLLKE